MKVINISVIIVTYRSADLTIKCLRSIEPELSSVGLNIHVIVVDNASGDAPAIATAIEAGNWQWVTLLSALNNGGFAYGNNIAIEKSYAVNKPDYLYLLNPDTELRPGAIDVLVAFLENHPEAGIAGSSFENEDGSDWPIAFRFPSILSEFEQGLEFGVVSRLLDRWVVARQMTAINQPIDWIPGASMMIRRKVVDAIGGLDENYFLYFEETDFCLRAKRAGFSTWYVPDSRVMHIAGQSTKLTERNVAAKRLPSYWFQSRRRYFAVNHGVFYSIIIDAVALIAHCLGFIKRLVLERRNCGTPYLMRDLFIHSSFWPKNWAVPKIKQFFPSVE